MTHILTNLFSAFVSGNVDSLSQIIERDVIKTMFTQPAQRNVQLDDRERRQRAPDSEDPLRVGPPQMPYPYGGGIGAGNQPFYAGQWPPPVGGADLGLRHLMCV